MCSRIVSYVFWPIWTLPGVPILFFIQWTIGRLYNFFLTLLELNWARVGAGAALGVVMSAIFFVMDSVFDPSTICATYVPVFTFVLGFFVSGFFCFMGFFKPFDPEEAGFKWPEETLRLLHLKTIDYGGFGGWAMGLAISCRTIILRELHFPDGIYPDDWCRPSPYVPAAWWGGTWFIIGMLVGSVKVKVFRVDAKFIFDQDTLGLRKENETKNVNSIVDRQQDIEANGERRKFIHAGGAAVNSTPDFDDQLPEEHV